MPAYPLSFEPLFFSSFSHSHKRLRSSKSIVKSLSILKHNLFLRESYSAVYSLTRSLSDFSSSLSSPPLGTEINVTYLSSTVAKSRLLLRSFFFFLFIALLSLGDSSTSSFSSSAIVSIFVILIESMPFLCFINLSA